MTYDTYFPEAAELADFIVKSIEKHYTIICQCEYGQSRSAACAAAIKEFYDKSGIQIFADYRYYPNKLIFNQLLAELVKHQNHLKGTEQCSIILQIPSAITTEELLTNIAKYDMTIPTYKECVRDKPYDRTATAEGQGANA